MPFFNFGVAACILIGVGYWAYRRLLPKPIPGIPYDKKSAQRILGDFSEAFKWQKETGEMWSYIRHQALRLDAPIFQMFMSGPFGKPWVIIADFREAQDIQMCRQGEFDRSAFLADVFGPLMPGNHVWMPSNDEFRAHRNLIKDTMSPTFLRNTVAPVMHTAIQELLELWREKVRLAQGRPFQADDDMVRAVVDVILSTTLGVQTRLSKTQTETLSSITKMNLPENFDSPAEFVAPVESITYTSIRTLIDSVQIGMASPAPRQHMKFALSFYPSLVAARKYTDKMMSDVLHAAWRKACRSKENDKVTSAADLVIRREVKLAEQQNRKAEYNTEVIRDELLGFYLAGHETTSTSLHWAVKHLTVYQEIQKKLVSALKTVHQQAWNENRLPTAQEIFEADVPYLDAFIEENHRLGTAIPTVVRRATRDAVVLGHLIPKETDVFMIMNGPSFQYPAFPIEEWKRSESSKSSKDRYGNWNSADVGTFFPERFLVRDDKENVKFDPFAGPVLPYGAGLRSCFGIKLAMLEMRLIITMMVWNFELLETPLALSSMKAMDKNTHKPEQTYLRPKPREYN